MNQLPRTLQYIYDSNWFPENFLTITEVPSEIIQKLKINHKKNEIKNHNAENQLTNIICCKFPF